MLDKPTTPVTCATVLPVAWGAPHLGQVESRQLHPPAIRPAAAAAAASDKKAEEISAKKFNDLMRKGYPDCPMPSWTPGHEQEQEDQEDEVQITKLQKIMGNAISRGKKRQRRQHLRSTAARVLPKKRMRLQTGRAPDAGASSSSPPGRAPDAVASSPRGN